MMNTHETFCPECERRLKLGGRPYQGQEIICNSCQAVLEVINTAPLELDISLTAGKKSKRQLKSETQEHIGKKHSITWR